MHMSFCNILALQSANTCKWSYSCIWEQAWLMSSRRFLKCWMVVPCHKEAREDYYSHVLAVFSWLIRLALLIRVNTPLELACYLTQTSDDNKRSVSKQSLLSFSRGLLNENAKVCLKCKKVADFYSLLFENATLLQQFLLLLLQNFAYQQTEKHNCIHLVVRKIFIRW